MTDRASAVDSLIGLELSHYRLIGRHRGYASSGYYLGTRKRASGASKRYVF